MTSLNESLFTDPSLSKEGVFKLRIDDQIDRYVEIGFHNVLHMTSEEYRQDLHRKLDDGIFDGNLFIVDPRIDIQTQLELANVECAPIFFEDPQIINRPNSSQEPYTILLSEKKEESAVEATLLEGIAVVIVNPSFLKISEKDGFTITTAMPSKSVASDR